jgi:hypothetical protein
VVVITDSLCTVLIAIGVVPIAEHLRSPAFVKLIKLFMDRIHILGSLIPLRSQLPRQVLDLYPILACHRVQLCFVVSGHMVKLGGELYNKCIVADLVLGDGIVKAVGHCKDLFG